MGDKRHSLRRFDNGIRKWFFINIAIYAAMEGLLLYFPMLLQRVVEIVSDGVISESDTVLRDMFGMGALVFGYIVLILTVNVISDYTYAAYTNRYARNVRGELFNKFQRVSSQTLEEYGAGKAVPAILNDTNWIRIYRRRVITAIVVVPIVILGSFFMIFMLNPIYGLIVLGFIPISLLFFWWNMRAMKRIIPPAVNAFDDYFVVIKEGITGAKDIRILGKEKERREEFSKLVKMQRKQAFNADVRNNMSASFSVFLFTITTIVIILYGIHFSMETARQLVYLNTTLQYITRIQWGTHNIFVWFAEHHPRMKVSKQRLFQVLDLPEVDADTATTTPDMAQPSLEIVGLSYKYPAGQRAISGLDIMVPSDSRIAIVGGIGSGKNMIPRLLLREHEPNEGSIILGGIDLSSINRMFLRRKIFSYIGPRALFVNGTVRDNMKLLAPNVTDAEIEGIFKELGAKDITKKFAGNFLDFELSDRVSLSESAKNILNIARGVIKPAGIYVFNQCFEHIKPEYMEKLMKHLAKHKKTALMLTYEKLVVQECDNVYLMKSGKISASGKHKDMFKNNSEYQKFYTMSAAEIIEDEIVIKDETEEERADIEYKEQRDQGTGEVM